METRVKQMVRCGLILVPFGIVNEFVTYSIKVAGINVKIGDVLGNQIVVCFDGYIGRA